MSEINKKNQNGLTNQEIEAGINGEVVIANNYMLMIKINMQADADSNFIYVVVERHYRRLYVVCLLYTSDAADE